MGPVCGAQLLVSSGDPGRMRSEASFAALAGTSPVDASSGKQRRHRLNRGGDRQLNWALHVVALARIRHHAETGAYYQRLLAAGKTTREARRCVKRALARHFYRRLREIADAPLDNIEASVPCRTMIPRITAKLQRRRWTGDAQRLLSLPTMSTTSSPLPVRGFGDFAAGIAKELRSGEGGIPNL